MDLSVGFQRQIFWGPSLWCTFQSLGCPMWGKTLSLLREKLWVCEISLLPHWGLGFGMVMSASPLVCMWPVYYLLGRSCYLSFTVFFKGNFPYLTLDSVCFWEEVGFRYSYPPSWTVHLACAFCVWWKLANYLPLSLCLFILLVSKSSSLFNLMC